MERLNRRNWLQQMGGLLAANSLFGKTEDGLSNLRRRDNIIIQENKKEGTTAWQLHNPQVSPPHSLWHMFGLRSNQIEGYCSHASIQAGERLDFFVNTDPVSSYQIDIYRMGYYGGKGGRKMTSSGPLEGIIQTTPEPGPNRVAECDWNVAYSLDIPTDWVSGVYLGKLTTGPAKVDSYVIFIVRDDRPVDLLFQCSDMTWQAYNRWPYNNSLYCTDEIDWHIGDGIDVSIRRPYSKYTQLVDQPLTVGSGEWFLTEFPFCYWMEKEGYDVSYIGNWDTHNDDPGIMRAKGFLSIGHDEYWSQSMFDHVKKGISNGLNVGFFSGNSVFCKIKLKPGSSGDPNIIFERDGRFSPRENTLIGAHSHKVVVGGGDYICQKPKHWIFKKTGMKTGDRIPGLVGWEYHCDPANIPGLEIVAGGKTDGRRHEAREEWEEDSAFMSTIYPGPKGNFVFNASTCWWADGLSDPPGYMRSTWYQKRFGPDKRVQRMTKNILDRMVG